jgi:hypothetical protein
MGGGPPVIEKVSLEVQYGDPGGVAAFYERAGLVHRRLLDQLGSPPFASGYEPSPFSASALASPTERLTVAYDHTHLVVTQHSVEAIARIEQVALLAWGEVDEQFELEGRVRQTGIRLFFMWPAHSSDEAEARILGLGLFQELPLAQRIFGAAPRRRSYTVVVGREDRPIRYHLAGATAVIELGAGGVASSLKKFAIPSGILLDVDCRRLFAGNLRRRIDQWDLASFIRESWDESTRAAAALGELL